MENNIKILSTSLINNSIIEKANSSGIDLDAIDFIQIVPIVDISLYEKISTILLQKEAIVFTSANAVKEVGVHNQNNNKFLKIFCIGKATKKEVETYFDSSLICGWANDAEELAKEILESGVKKITFFCGNKRLDTLPNILKLAGITLTEVVVYETIENPIKLNCNYDAILFFSPSCVNSFFSANSVLPEVVLFAIGNTTANALKEKVNNKIVICREPKKDQIILDAIGYFNKLGVEKQLEL